MTAYLLVYTVPMYCAVDLLERVGLKDADFPKSDAILTDGAFQLQRELSIPIDTTDLRLIGAHLSSQFGLYTVFNTVQYTGSVIFITSDDDSTPLFTIMLQASDTSPNFNSLRISLRGLESTFELPAATTDSPFQDIGIKLQDSLLVISLNCTVIDFAILKNESVRSAMSLTGGRVRIFGPNAIVSWIVYNIFSGGYTCTDGYTL